jgi:hypothetical protein
MTNEQRIMALHLGLDPGAEDTWPVDLIDRLLAIRARSLREFDDELDKLLRR